MRAQLILSVVAALSLTGCVMDSLVEAEEAQVRAVRREIDGLEIRLGTLRTEVRRLEKEAGPEAIALRKAELEADLERYGLRVTSRGAELVVTLASTVLFDPGQVSVREDAKPSLAALAKAIRNRFPGRLVRIEGHTDSTRPIRVADRYPTNWELSAARSLAVLQYIVDAGGMPRDKAIAAAYGQYRPVMDNSTAEGREANRRVDIVIVPPVEVERSMMISEVIE